MNISFRSPCNRVVSIPSMVSYDYSEDHSANVNRLVGTTFNSFIWDIFLNREKNHETTLYQNENAKFHLGYCGGASVNFCNVCRYINPRTNVEIHLLTIALFLEKERIVFSNIYKTKRSHCFYFSGLKRDQEQHLIFSVV